MKQYKFECGCSFPIDEAEGLIFGKPSIIVDYENLNYNCPLVWQLLSSGRTRGVFQLEETGRNVVKKVKPTIMDHLSATMTVIRPGCANSKNEEGVSMTDVYCNRKNGIDPVKYFHPALEPILKESYGVLIYQEQILEIAKQLAGFTLQEADSLRKSIGKKLAELMAKNKLEFIIKAEAFGIITKKDAEAIFDNIEKSQKYLFNKCVSGDTRILRSSSGRNSPNKGYTIEEMYLIRNNIEYAKKTGHLSLHRKWKRLRNYGKGISLYDDGKLRPNTIENIQEAGVRVVYKITLKNGNSIRITDNHKFPTPNGEKRTYELKIGDLLYTKGEYEKGNGKTYGFSNITHEERKEKNKNSNKSVSGEFGKNNFGYTNGSYSNFVKNKLLLINFCNKCKIDDVRLETHHINGDRSNSNIDNLEKLCVSCHKKAEYANGRVKRGEKGYPNILVPIVSIEIDGSCMTYDVTMQAPNHNFTISNGIVTSNSHAFSYAVMAYETAYCKTHFPLQFFTNYLYYSKDKQDPIDEIKKVVIDAKSFGFEVIPPRFTKMRKHFWVDDNNVDIMFGLSDVKGIGEKHVEKIRANALKMPIPATSWTWYDFLTLFSDQCTSTTVRSMIEVGALRHLPHDRKLMLAEYEAFSELSPAEKVGIASLSQPIYKEKAKKERGMDGKLKSVRNEQDEIIYEKVLGDDNRPILLDEPRPAKNLQEALQNILDRPGVVSTKRRDKVASLLELLRNPPTSVKDSPLWICKVEEEKLGVSLTLAKISSAYTPHADTKILEYTKGKRGDSFVIACEIQDFRAIKIKNGDNRGREMAFLTVSDETATMEDVVVFPDIWDQFGNRVFQGNVVEITGKRSYSKGSFIVDEINQVG